MFNRLLEKVEEQRRAYGGKVFDVLGAAFDEIPLRDLLIGAIRYGDLPETRANMEQVIDDTVAHGLKELIGERALANDVMSNGDLAQLQQAMEEARARRLQPHYIEWAFRHAFQRLGGRLVKRERGRYEITHIPPAVRAVTQHGPIASRYERVAFDLDRTATEPQLRADLLAPGHPLHDAVVSITTTQLRPALERGTVLVSPDVDEPRLLVGVVEEVVDGTGESIARRFGYAHVDATGQVTSAGPAPYLDCAAAPRTAAVASARRLPWLSNAESQARTWIIGHQLKDYLTEVAPRRHAEIERLRTRIAERLTRESNRLLEEAIRAQEKERLGGKPKESPEGLRRKAQDLLTRRENRLEVLDRQAQLSMKPPRITTAALVLPLSIVEADIPAGAPVHANETKAVERRGVELVLATERALGREPREQVFNNPGYDVLSVPADDGPSIRIEVKARLDGAEDFYVTHNEVVTGKNSTPHYRLALVSVSKTGPVHDQVRYLDAPFSGVEFGDLAATGILANWTKMWNAGSAPF